MSNEFEYVNLTGDSLYVCDFGNFRFLKDFDSDLLVGGFMDGGLDLAEGALTESFACMS
jgi:hypothetical protein